MPIVLFIIGAYQTVASFMAAKKQYSRQPFKLWCRKRTQYFLSSVVSVVAFALGELAMLFKLTDSGLFFGIGFIVIIARPCSIESINQSRTKTVLRNIFWLVLASLSIYIPDLLA